MKQSERQGSDALGSAVSVEILAKTESVSACLAVYLIAAAVSGVVEGSALTPVVQNGNMTAAVSGLAESDMAAAAMQRPQPSIASKQSEQRASLCSGFQSEVLRTVNAQREMLPQPLVAAAGHEIGDSDAMVHEPQPSITSKQSEELLPDLLSSVISDDSGPPRAVAAGDAAAEFVAAAVVRQTQPRTASKQSEVVAGDAATESVAAAEAMQTQSRQASRQSERRGNIWRNLFLRLT